MRVGPPPSPLLPIGGVSSSRGVLVKFIVLCPPKCSHDLPSLAGLYTRKPFQSPEGYSRAAGSI